MSNDPAEYDAAWVEGFLLAPDRVQRYPRASRYDPRWIFENHRGSHCLWLAEALCAELPLEPGMRVLDLGCWSAIEAIFLAREYGVQVWAVDLHADPTGNWERICAAGVQNRVFPMRGDGRDLPYAAGFFDAVVSINSLQLYGTNDLYVRHLARLVRPGGWLGVVVPGLLHEFDGAVPEHLRPYWCDYDFIAYHSPEWWRRHWDKAGLLDIKIADTFPDGEGYTIFSTWEQVVKNPEALVTEDRGRNLTFVRLVARKR